MPTSVQVGKKVAEIELLDLFQAHEGQISQYYGRIGNGKTYAATADVLDLLRRGKVVYVNWPINFQGYDERESLFRVMLTLFLPFIKRFYYFPPENLKYFELSDAWAVSQGYDDFVHWLGSRTDCDMFMDEGHVMFDSYVATKMSLEKRAAILHTRHFNRSIHIVSQRPTAIHVSMRANVNIFYKCEKYFQFGSLVRFRRLEFQEMTAESVDENPDNIVSVKHYWGKKRIFNAYNTRYLRGNISASQKNAFEAYELTYKDKLQLIKNFFIKEKKVDIVEPENEERKLLKEVLKKHDIEPVRALVLHRLSTQPFRRVVVNHV